MYWYSMNTVQYKGDDFLAQASRLIMLTHIDMWLIGLHSQRYFESFVRCVMLLHMPYAYNVWTNLIRAVAKD